MEAGGVSSERAAAFVEHARRYGELGWALAKLNGKVPRARDWQSAQPDHDLEHMAGLWAVWGERANMGVVLGPSGLCVVEYDTDEAGRTLSGLMGDLPATPTAMTGSG